MVSQRTQDRPIGWTFLLFVPYLAYLGYDIWLKWTAKNVDGKLQNQQHIVDQYNNKGKQHMSNFPKHSPAQLKESTDSALASTVRQMNITCKSNQAIADSKFAAATDNITNFSNEKHKLVSTPTGQQLRIAITNMIRGIAAESECHVLVYMLQSSELDMLKDGLNLIISLSTRSTETTSTLFRCGCGNELKRLLRSYCQNPEISELIIIALNNMSLSSEGQLQFEDMVDQLMDACSLSENLRLASLRALTNLSVTEGSHTHFTKVVQRLYKLLDGCNVDEKLQLCKLLVNLSINRTLVQYLLAAKAPSCTVELLSSDDDVISLRWLRFLVNLSNTVRKDGFTADDLPMFYRAPSPETMYSCMFSQIGSTNLRNRLLARRSNDEEIITLTNKLYNNLKTV